MRWLDTHDWCCEGCKPRPCCVDCTGPMPGRKNIHLDLDDFERIQERIQERITESLDTNLKSCYRLVDSKSFPTRRTT